MNACTTLYSPTGSSIQMNSVAKGLECGPHRCELELQKTTGGPSPPSCATEHSSKN